MAGRSWNKPYNPAFNRCNLCLWEKYLIFCRPDLSTLNKRNELINSCRHANKSLLIQSDYEPVNLENGSFLNSYNFDAADLRFWSVRKLSLNATVREYAGRCNTVENVHIHKGIGPWDRVNLVRETEAIIRKVLLVRSPKQVIVLIFYIPLTFFVLFFPSYAVSETFFLVLIHFFILGILKNPFSIELQYHKDSNMFRPLRRVKPSSVGLVVGWVTKCEDPML